MPPTTQGKPKSRAEQEAQQKAYRRAEEANIIVGVRAALEGDEQLLAFSRGRIAGGWRGKLNVGPEAFVAPFVNMALTERRFLIQHVHHVSGRPGGAKPHSYPLSTITKITFMEIETFGGEPAGRLVVYLENGVYVRLRMRGEKNCRSAKTMGDLFQSLTITREKITLSPSLTTCVHCSRQMDQPYKFCPYCGTAQPGATSGADAHGPTLATPDGENNGEQTVENAEPATPRREVDFAYEFEEQPSAFGLAMPLPDGVDAIDLQSWEDDESEEDAGAVDATANGPILADDAVDTGRQADIAEQDTTAVTARETPLAEEMFVPDELTGLTPTSDGNDFTPRDFTELPYTKTADVFEAGYDTTFGVAETITPVVRDDASEAFMPTPSEEVAAEGEATVEGDTFTDSPAQFTGDDNIDFNTGAVQEQDAPPSDGENTSAEGATEESAPMENASDSEPHAPAHTDAAPESTSPAPDETSSEAEHAGEDGPQDTPVSQGDYHE